MAVMVVDDSAGVGLLERGNVDGADCDFAGSADGWGRGGGLRLQVAEG